MNKFLHIFEDDLRRVSKLRYYDDEARCTKKKPFVDDTGATTGERQPLLYTLYTIRSEGKKIYKLGKSHGYMSTTSSPCNLHSSISFSTSSSPSPEPSSFTLFASQKLTFTQSFKCLPRFKKHESFFCCLISIFFCQSLHPSLNLCWHCSPEVANTSHTSVDGRWKGKPCTPTFILGRHFFKETKTSHTFLFDIGTGNNVNTVGNR